MLSKLYDKSVTLAEPLPFLNMIDIGTLHLLHQHHLLLVLLVPKMPNGSKMPNLHCNGTRSSSSNTLKRREMRANDYGKIHITFLLPTFLIHM